MKINLNIEADSPDQLREVLGKLLGGQAVNVTVNKVEVKDTQPDRFVEAVVEAVKVPEPKPATPAATRAPRAKKPEVEAAPAPTPEPTAQADEPQAAAEPTPAPAPEKKAKSKTTAVMVEPGAEGINIPAVQHLPESVKNASSMREILTYFADNGVTDVDTMIKACTAVRGQVAILQKVPDVDSRVRRAAEVLGLFAPSDEVEAAAD